MNDKSYTMVNIQNHLTGQIEEVDTTTMPGFCKWLQRNLENGTRYTFETRNMWFSQTNPDQKSWSLSHNYRDVYLPAEVGKFLEGMWTLKNYRWVGVRSLTAILKHLTGVPEFMTEWNRLAGQMKDDARTNRINNRTAKLAEIVQYLDKLVSEKGPEGLSEVLALEAWSAVRALTMDNESLLDK